MSLLVLDQVSVAVGPVTLVESVNLEIAPGQLLAIIGPNGAGKTSLLRAIAGDIPSRGRIDFAGSPLAALAPETRARQLAVLTQHNTLNFAFTVAEVVGLGRGPHSTGYALDNQLCQEAMAALDVAHLSGRNYLSLSGGEQQRVQLARVMAQIWRAEDAPQRLLLLDEPVTSLDIGHQHQLMQAVRRFADSGVAVVMVVHDITLAAAYSDTLLALAGGRTVAAGNPETVVTEALIGELFNTRVRVLPHPETGKPVVLGAQ